MKVKEESEKIGLKLSIPKTEIIASSPITSWQIDKETMETVTDFIWEGAAPKSLQMVTAAMKLRCLLLGRKSMTNLDSILKSRHIILPTKFHLIKAMVFPVVMYGCESWTIKKAAAAAATKLLQMCPTLCDPMICSMPGLPVYYQLPEFTQTHIH